MAPVERNGVRERRMARGLTQNELAQLTELTRQSIHAIEAGRARPSVDVAMRLAHTLDCSVERLFGKEESACEALKVECLSEVNSPRVVVVEVAGRWHAIPLASDAVQMAADGVLSELRNGRGIVSLVRARQEVGENVLLVGCAVALGVLANRLNLRQGPGGFLWKSGSSASALEAIWRGTCHVGGVHLAASPVRTGNLAGVRRTLWGRAIAVVSLGVWEEGMLLRTGEVNTVASFEDALSRKLRLVLRERGSGARRVLERELQSSGETAALKRRRQSSPVVGGHLDVARAIALGFADVGIASKEAADAFGLALKPLSRERFDLVLPTELLGDARLQRMVDVMVSKEFRKDISALGCDMADAGVQIAQWEVDESRVTS